jgi:hypothetical protein
LLGFFKRLLPLRQFRQLPSLQKESFYDRLFTPWVTLWYLIFQRLGADHTLEKVVADALAGGADGLGVELSEKLRSTATTSYSDARQRLPLAFLSEALALQARRMLALSPTHLWHGLVIHLLDGSTVRLRPYGDIPQKFPPHRNQAKSPAYWCLMRVVVGFCAQTGAALSCAWGSLGLSEQELACRIILQKTFGPSLYLGDRNFGIFRIVQAARAAQAHVLLRMTQFRARKLLGRSLRLGDHALTWKPTRHDQLGSESSRAPIAGRLLVVRVKRNGFRALTLYLFSTLPGSQEYPVEELVRLYGLRWHIELNLRYLKTQMRLVQLECKSAEMAQKEWFAGLMAYNLIRAAMLCAGLHKGLSPLELSFSSSRRYLESWLAHFARHPRRGLKRWEEMLRFIQRARLPKRPQPRPPEPRAQRHLRQPFPPLIGSRKKARRQVKKYAAKS